MTSGTTRMNPDRFHAIIRDMSVALALVELCNDCATPRIIWSKDDALFRGNLRHTTHGLALLLSAIEKKRDGLAISHWESKAILRFQDVMKQAYRACVYAKFYRTRFSELAGVAEAIDLATSQNHEEALVTIMFRLKADELDALMMPRQPVKTLYASFTMPAPMMAMPPISAPATQASPHHAG